jgi:hypothetical protein
MSVPKHLVPAPSVTPHRYGLFSVAQPRTGDATDGDAHWRNGIQWVSDNCVAVNLTDAPCDQGSLSATPGCELRQFDPFTIYAYNTDDIPGFTLAEHRQRTVDRLTIGEQKEVEFHVWNEMLAEADGCLDMTAQPGWEALGIAEQAAQGIFNGGGVLHMSRMTAMALALHLVVEGATLRTKLGTPVVAGAGYDFNQTFGFGTIALTGPVIMYRSEVDVSEAVDKASNTVSIVAQRDYVVGWDCGTLCVTANLCAPPECVPEVG